MLPSQTTHASKILGTDGTNTTWVNPGAAYQTSAPSNPVTGQLWVDSDETGDSLDPYIIRRKTITATAGQTVFTTDVVFTDGYEQIYYNGVLLVRTTDYTTSGGTNTVTLLQGASAGDTVDIISSTPINLVNAATLTTNTFTGNQGIGGSPLFPIHQIGTVAPNISADTYSATGGPAYLGRRSRGTIASPSSTQAGDGLNAFIARGYGATAFGSNNVAAILLNAEENFTDTSQPTYIDFGTTASGSVSRSQRMRINSAGDISISTAYATLSGTAGNGQWRIRGKYTGDTAPYPSEMISSINWNTTTNTQDTAVNGSAYTSLYGASNGASGFALYTGGNGATPTEKFKVDTTGTGYVTAPNWTVAPLSGALNPTIKIRNSHWTDGSPNQLIMGVDGTMFNGVAFLDTSNAGVAGVAPLSFRVAGTERIRINANGSVSIPGSLSKGSGSFKIDHPLPELKDEKYLVHSFIEGPQADLIYRGVIELVNGSAEVNIDQSAGMTEGTFLSLCRDIQCFTSNESDWDAVRGKVNGNVLEIESINNQSTAKISWMVLAERKDQHMYDTGWTDETGKVIVEPLKELGDDNE
jgi:hypothetical protein